MGEDWIFETAHWPARRVCGLWPTWLVVLHVASLAATSVCYLVAIPLYLRQLVPSWAQRSGFLGGKLPRLLIFGGWFIAACGAAHVGGLSMFWWPAYRFLGVLLVHMALASATFVGWLDFELAPRWSRPIRYVLTIGRVR